MRLLIVTTGGLEGGFRRGEGLLGLPLEIVVFVDGGGGGIKSSLHAVKGVRVGKNMFAAGADFICRSWAFFRQFGNILRAFSELAALGVCVESSRLWISFNTVVGLLLVGFSNMDMYESAK